MKLSRRSHREWKIFFWVSLASIVVSCWFGLWISPPGTSRLGNAILSVASSLLIATPILLFELNRYRIPFARRLRRVPLPVYFSVKVAFYLVIIICGLLLSRLLTQPITGVPVDFGKEFRSSIVFAIAMSVGGNLVFEMGGLLGFGTLKNLLTGRYVQPRREQRVFVLIDMKNSTGMAERLGPVRFHALLNDFFRDVTDAALECGAEIHKYVGDEAILTWTGAEALKDGDCLACPFVVEDLIEAHKSAYLRRFGAVPEFRASCHFGEIVAGEIGDVRREIAYVGDTLNVAARLLEAAKELGRDVLVSTDLLEHAALPAELDAEKLPTLTMRGRAAPLGVAALQRA